MKQLTTASSTFLMLAVSASTAPAQMATQIDPLIAQGHFSNWAVGVSHSSAVSSAAGSPKIRAPGVGGGVPVAWTAATFGATNANHPDYSLSALTLNWPVSGLSPEFGGTSTGGDVTPQVTSTGVLIATTDNWYSLTISVADGAQGVTTSLIDRQRTYNGSTGRSVGGDIFSYYMAGGDGIDPAFLDTVRVEYTKEQLGDSHDLKNLDWGIGIISVDPGKRAGPLFPVSNKFYFTLSKAWLATNDGQVLTAVGLVNDTADARTVYEMTWDQTTGWSAPGIAYSPTDLFGSQSGNTNLEIDAISVYRTSSEDRIVFSLTKASDFTTDSPPVLNAYNQILVFQRSTGGATPCGTTSLKVAGTPSSVRVTEKFGLVERTSTGEPDDVDSTCGLDPKRLELSAPLLYPVVGMAMDTMTAQVGGLGLSSMRTTLPDPTYTGSAPIPMVDTLNFQVTGLDVSGYLVGAIQFYLEGPEILEGDSDEEPVEPVEFGEPIIFLGGQVPMNTINVSGPVPSTPTTTLRMSARILGANPPSFTPVELRSSWILSYRY